MIMTLRYSLLLMSIMTSSIIWANETPITNDTTSSNLTEQKEKNRWIDKRHDDVKTWLAESSNHIDDWFGKVDRNRPATANLRVIVDNQWHETDGFHSQVRVRGKIRLPTLEKRLSIVFGDESLEQESDRQVTVDEPTSYDSNKKIDLRQNSKDNGSLALRFSKWNDDLPFDADFDIGLRSHDNIFARLKISKEWQLSEHTGLYTENMYRYSTKNKNEVRSFWDLHYQEKENTQIAWQTNLTYMDKSDDDLTWDSSVFRQHHFAHSQFPQAKRLSYGVQSTGYFNEQHLYAKEWELNRWGPFASWRQPLWREWFFIQTDVHYLNDKRNHQDHQFGSNVRLEVLF